MRNKGVNSSMLNKQICKAVNVDPVEEFFVNEIDKLDDLIENEIESPYKTSLKHKKEIMLKLRQDYQNLQTN